MSNANERFIHRQRVFGIDIDAETRCKHWSSPLDIVAIRFKCCGDWFACYECHRELLSHSAERWTASERWQAAIMCGHCGTQLTIGQYLDGDTKCPACRSEFNPGCRYHDHLYFEFRDYE